MSASTLGRAGFGERTRRESIRDGRTNAVIAWALVAILTAVFVESVFEADYRWILFVSVVGFVVLVPPVAFREWRVMLPWELLVLAWLPILARGLVGGTVGTFASYLSLAALALLVIVELHMFTDLALTHWFAIGLVVLTTLPRWRSGRSSGGTPTGFSGVVTRDQRRAGTDR